MMATLQAVLVRGIFWMIRLIPVRLAGAIGAGAGRMAFYLIQRRRDIAVRNLERVYPDQTSAWHQHIARESFAEMGRTMFEIPHVFLRSKAFLQSRVQVEGKEEFLAAMAAGKGAFNIFYHHSNWELCGIMYATLTPDVDGIYRAVKQPALEQFVKQCRERFGVSMHARQQGLRWLPGALKRGHSIAILLDQHLSIGMPVPFMGHLANTSTLPATIVLKHGTPVFGVALHRIGKGFHFRMQLWRIDTPAPSGDKDKDIYRITEHIGKTFESAIHQRPELWLWSHQRWLWLEEQESQVSEKEFRLKSNDLAEPQRTQRKEKQ